MAAMAPFSYTRTVAAIGVLGAQAKMRVITAMFHFLTRYFAAFHMKYQRSSMFAPASRC